ncbi:hypothetical protein Tco_0919702 [Tanacetum coccineum]
MSKALVPRILTGEKSMRDSGRFHDLVRAHIFIHIPIASGRILKNQGAQVKEDPLFASHLLSGQSMVVGSDMKTTQWMLAIQKVTYSLACAPNPL